MAHNPYALEPISSIPLGEGCCPRASGRDGGHVAFGHPQHAPFDAPERTCHCLEVEVFSGCKSCRKQDVRRSPV
jgi:hypothetical protein